MKVTILPQNITPFIPLINKLLPSHSQVPILSNILLEARNNGFFVKATDLEMGGEVMIPAKIEIEGTITIPGKEFLESLNSLPKDKITIEVKDDVVFLKCRDTKISFNTIPSDEFPQLFKDKGELVTSFKRIEFDDIFSYLSFSVSQDESRPQLTGVFLDSKEGSVNFVSTDGYRMSVKSLKQQKKVKEKLIIAAGLINEAMALKSDEDIMLFVNKEESQVVLETGNVVIVGRMIEGIFPDYEKVLPNDSKTTVVFDREELLRSVRLASVFAKDSSNIVNLSIEGGKMVLSTKTQGIGEGETVVDCEQKGDDNKIAFNIKYLLDILKTATEEQMSLRLNGPTEPAAFDIKEKGFTHVIMPIQVED